MSDHIEYVVISWVDATHTDHGTWKAEDIPDAVVMTSAGLLVEENGNAIKVARDKHNGEDAWRHAISIPKCNVVKIDRIQLQEITAEECDRLAEETGKE